MEQTPKNNLHPSLRYFLVICFHSSDTSVIIITKGGGKQLSSKKTTAGRSRCVTCESEGKA